MATISIAISLPLSPNSDYTLGKLYSDVEIFRPVIGPGQRRGRREPNALGPDLTLRHTEVYKLCSYYIGPPVRFCLFCCRITVVIGMRQDANISPPRFPATS